LPDGSTPDSAVGVNLNKAYTIEKDGTVTIPISDFPLNSGQLAKVIQISVHSGDNAWNKTLNQPASKIAVFLRIEHIKAKVSALDRMLSRAFGVSL